MPRSPDVCYPDIPEIQPEVSSQTSHDLNNFLLVDKTHASRSNQLFNERRNLLFIELEWFNLIVFSF